MGRYADRATVCYWCGQPADPVRGVYLELLYPGRSTCSGCGRLQLFCDCPREPAGTVGPTLVSTVDELLEAWPYMGWVA